MRAFAAGETSGNIIAVSLSEAKALDFSVASLFQDDWFLHFFGVLASHETIAQGDPAPAAPPAAKGGAALVWQTA